MSLSAVILEKISLPTYPFQRQSYWLEKGSGNNLLHPLTTNQTPNITASTTPDFYQIYWQLNKELKELIVPNSKVNLADCWLIFSDRQGIGAKIAAELRARGNTCQLVTRQDANQIDSILADCSDLGGIIYLWGLDRENSDSLELSQQWKTNCNGLLDLVRGLTRQGTIAPIWLVTSGNWAIENEIDIDAITASSIVGIGQAIAVEHPEYWGGIIDLAGEVTDKQINHLIQLVASKEREDRLALRGDRVYVSRLVKTEIPTNHNFKITPNSAYLITGAWVRWVYIWHAG